MKRLLATAAVVVGLVIAGCGGDDGGDEETTTTAPSTELEAPSGATPPGGLGALPPGFVECMAEEGYDVQSPADIHSAPPQVLQMCFAH